MAIDLKVPEQMYEFFSSVMWRVPAFHYAVAEGNRVDASEKINLSPARVGQIIDELDHFLAEPLNDGSLIDRSARKVRPSDAGALLYAYTKGLFADTNAVIDNIRKLQHSNEVRVAIINSAWNAYGPDLTETFKKRLPGGAIAADVIGGEDYPEKILDAVVKGRADIGITSFPPKASRPIVFQPLLDRELVAVFSPQYSRLPKGRTIKLDRIFASDPMLKICVHKQSLGSPLTFVVLPYLRANDAFPGKSNVIERESIEQIKETIRNFPDHVAILPVDAVKLDEQQKVLVSHSLSPKPPPWKWGMFYRSGTTRKAVHTFIECMQPFFNVSKPKANHKRLA